jgi:signal transduction histidine kinase
LNAVQKETQKRVEKAKKYEVLNEILVNLNRKNDLFSFLQTILNNVSTVLKSEYGSVLYLKDNDSVFKFIASKGWSKEKLNQIEFVATEIDEQFLIHSRKVAENIYILKNFEERKYYDRFSDLVEVPKSSLIFSIKSETRIKALIFFDNLENKDAFDKEDIPFLESLYEYLFALFQKTKRLADIEELNGNKNELLRIISHDLKNPISNIIGFTELSRNYFTEETLNIKLILRNLEIIGTNAEDMLSMVNDILNASAIESGKFEVQKSYFSLDEHLKQRIYIFENVAKQKNIQLSFEIIGEATQIFADGSKLYEAIENIISNAIKFTSKFGKVDIVLRYADNVYLFIQDTGQGLHEDEIEKMFTPFVVLSSKPTGNEKSHGVGLSISKKFIDAHNGEIVVDSKKNVGTIFKIVLPYE